MGTSQQHHPVPSWLTAVRTILELEWELTPQTLKVEARIFPKGKLECCTKKMERMK